MNIKDILQEKRTLKELHIMESTLFKTYLYASMLREMSGRALECYGYLVAPTYSYDGIATDAVLSIGQSVSESDCIVDFSSEYSTIEEIRQRGQKIVGWWHSHGNHPTFHSELDDANMDKLTQIISPHNIYHHTDRRVELGEGPLQVVKDRSGITRINTDDKKRTICIKTETGLESIVRDAWIEEREGHSYSYSLVVNSHLARPYGEVRNCLRNETTTKKGYIVNIINDDCRNIGVGQIARNIRERIKSDNINWRKLTRKEVNKIMKRVRKKIDSLKEDEMSDQDDNWNYTSRNCEKRELKDNSLVRYLNRCISCLKRGLTGYIGLLNYSQNEAV